MFIKKIFSKITVIIEVVSVLIIVGVMYTVVCILLLENEE
jgi:hypothetical protein